jgi:hypothetical protein
MAAYFPRGHQSFSAIKAKLVGDAEGVARNKAASVFESAEEFCSAWPNVTVIATGKPEPFLAQLADQRSRRSRMAGTPLESVHLIGSQGMAERRPAKNQHEVSSATIRRTAGYGRCRTPSARNRPPTNRTAA